MILVFGSNLAGRHGGKAGPLEALRHYGRFKRGVGFGHV